MMDAPTRLKLTLGDLFMQLALAHARIEELEEKLKDKPEAEIVRGPNGRKRAETQP